MKLGSRVLMSMRIIPIKVLLMLRCGKLPNSIKVIKWRGLRIAPYRFDINSSEIRVLGGYGIGR